MISVSAAVNKTSEVFENSGAIPSGFKFLNNPQKTVADFFYGDRYLASLSVSYTPTTIKIEQPELLIARIPNITRPDILQKILTGNIPVNSASICVAATSQNCGILSPKVAGVIFDARHFRADVFIAEPYLLTQSLYKSRFLPESESGLGLVQGFSLTTSGASGDSDDSYLLGGDTILGWRENHLVSDWDIGNNNPFSADTLFLERDVRGMRYGAGYLDSDNLVASKFIQSGRLLGFRGGTSQASRLDSANITASPIQFFSATRGRVEVLRNNRLIYAGQVDAGSQLLNTASFPTGSYQVTVRVFNGSALAQEFTRLYVKSVRLPPSDEFLWSLEGGSLTRRNDDEILPESEDAPQIRGGTSFRLSERSSLGLTGVATKDEQLAEAEIYYQGDGWYTTGSGLVGTNSAKGIALDGSAIFGEISVNAYYRQLWKKNNQPSGSTSPVLLGGSFESGTISASAPAPVLGGNVSLSHSNNRDSSNVRTRVSAISWFRNLLTFSNYDLSMQLDYSHGSNDKLALASFTIRRSENNWDIGMTGEYQKNTTNDASSNAQRYLMDARWRNSDLESGYLEAGMNYEALEAENNLRADLSYDNSRFASAFTVDYRKPDNSESTTAYTGRIDTTLAVNETGVSMGGRSLAESALIVTVEGSSDTVFDVEVNGNLVGFARGDGSAVIPLTPFSTYQVKILPRGNDFFDYDQSVKTVTLYPGNVKTVQFTSKQVVVILGRLTDTNGQVLAKANIGEGRALSQSNEYGVFQTRVDGNASELSVSRANGETCRVQLPEEIKLRSGVGMVGELRCR